MTLNGGLAGGSLNLAASDAITLNGNSIQGGTLHGGSLLMKAVNGLTMDRNGSIVTAGGALGGVQQLFAGTTLRKSGLVQANGGISGGSVFLQSNQKIIDEATIVQANGNQYGGYLKLKAPSIPDPVTLSNAGITPGTLEANGSMQNGQIIQDTSP